MTGKAIRHEAQQATLAKEEAPPAEPADAARDVGWERLWLATQRAPWVSLALIPVGAGISTPHLAAELAEMGERHLGHAVAIHDATALTLRDLRAARDKLAQRAGCAERVIVALPEVVESPACLALAQAVDAVILCVALDSSVIAEAERIVDEIGRARVLGSVIVRDVKRRR